jgi:hypothetical protein
MARHGMLVGTLLLAAATVAVASAGASASVGKYTCPSPGFKPFTCPQLPTPPAAADVRHLRPGNIGAVIAIGDSITAGACVPS